MGDSPPPSQSRARLPLKERPKSDGPRLSQREAEVLDLLGEGLTNKQIADRLVVSESTVRTHVYRILEKLDFERRHEAVIYAMHQRLGPAETTAQAPPEAPAGAEVRHGIGALKATRSDAGEPGMPASGERKQATALLIRIDSFNVTDEPMDPNRLEEVLPECLDLIGGEIRRHDGVVAWQSAEGLVSLFGVPLATEHAPQQALIAALQILKCQQECAEDLKRKGVGIVLRIGVNTGPVQVQRSADGLTTSYVAIGDTTRLAAAVRDMARQGTILLTQNTYDLTKKDFDFKRRIPAQVRGSPGPVTTYRLLGRKGAGHGPFAALPRSLTSFVGRDQEIEALAGAFAKASSGFGRVVGIVGEAGVGKSRLVAEFKHRISKHEFVWLEGSCLHYGGHVAYLPLLAVLRSCFAVEQGEAESAAKEKMRVKLEESGLKTSQVILPPLQDILSLEVDDRDYLKLEPAQKRERIFEAIKSLLLQEGEHQAAVVVIDDAQWIDRTSEEFLGYLMNSLPDSRILLLLLYRPEYVHGWGSKSVYSQIRVDDLSPRSSVQLIQSILGDVSADLCRYITNRAQGNPLYIEEFINTLMEEDAIVKVGDSCLLRPKPTIGKIPYSIQGIIQSRIDRLEQGLKRAMQVASVIGPEFNYSTLQAATGMGRELKGHLLDLQQSDFIYEKRLSPEPEYVFKHNLIREISYSSLVAAKRWEFHEKVGEAVERLYHDKLEMCYEVLAHHYSRSRNSEKAYRYLELSAAKASRSYSNWEAFRLGKEALRVLEKMPVTDENKIRGIDARTQLEGSMRLLAYPEDSWEILEEGARLAREIDDARSLAVFYSSMGLYWTFKGEPTRGIEYSTKCISEAEKAEDTAILASVGFDLCSAYALTGEYLKTVELAPRVTGLLERHQKEHDSFGGPFAFDLYCALRIWYGHALCFLGNFKEGQRVLDKAVRFAEETGSLHTMAFAELMYGFAMEAKGEGQDAIRHLQEAMQHAERGEIIPVLVMSHTALGWAYGSLGKIETALKHMQMSLDLRKESGFGAMLSMSLYHLAIIQLDSGDLESARSSAEQALGTAKQSGDQWVEAAAKLVLGTVLVRQDISQSAAAEKCILEGMAVLDELGTRPIHARGSLCLGELYAATGQRRKASDNLKKAAAAFQEMDMSCFLDKAQKTLQQLRTSVN